MHPSTGRPPMGTSGDTRVGPFAHRANVARDGYFKLLSPGTGGRPAGQPDTTIIFRQPLHLNDPPNQRIT